MHSWAKIQSINAEFLKKEELQAYINEHLKPRLKCIKAAIMLIAENEPKYPKEDGKNLDNVNITDIIKQLNILESTNKMSYDSMIKDELQSYNILKTNNMRDYRV